MRWRRSRVSQARRTGTKNPGADAPDPWANGPPLAFSSDRRWWRRAGITSFGVWASVALGFLGTVVAARELGPDSYGAVVLAVAIATLIATFLDLTLEYAVVHHGFRVLADEDYGQLRTLIRVAFAIDLAGGLLVGGLIFALADPIADVISDGTLDPALVRVASLITVAGTVDGTTAAILSLAQRPDLRGWAMAATGLARLLGVVVAVTIGGEFAVVTAFVLGAAAGSVLQAALAWRVAWRKWRTAKGTGNTRAWARNLTSFGLFTSITTSAASVQSAVTPVILGALSGTSTVGAFAVALFPVNLANLATSPLRVLLFPEQAKLAADGNVQGLRKGITAATRIGIFLGVPAAIAGWFLLPAIIDLLYTDAFDEAVTGARILLLTAVIHLMGAWGKTFFAAIGRPQLQTVIQILYAVLTVVAMAALASEGVTGAAVAYSVTNILTTIPFWFLAFRMLRQMESGSGPTPATAS